MSTNERPLNANCNKTEIAKAIILSYGNQKQHKSICITNMSSGTCDNALCTNITIQETCAEPKNKQMGC